MPTRLLSLSVKDNGEGGESVGVGNARNRLVNNESSVLAGRGGSFGSTSFG